jgi:hypothetical protein
VLGSQVSPSRHFSKSRVKVKLIGASKEVGLEVNAERTKYMLLSRHQNARQNHSL